MKTEDKFIAVVCLFITLYAMVYIWYSVSPWK
jgi:hypothetical protein